MKKRLFSLSILLSLCGCEKELVYDTIIDEVPVVDNTFVNSIAIQKYAQASFPLSKSDSLEFKIEAITDFAGDTLMYVINFANGNGWKIISADTRTPSILAEGDYGSFSLNNASPSVNVWLDSVKRNMSLIRKSSDEALSFSAELIRSYKSFWNQFSSYALQKPMDPEENGDWFSHTDIEIIVDETVDHLVAKWDQNHPYNTYCPYIDQETGIRAVTGCVAIAAGQLLYFLHDKLGIPSQMVSSGYCVGDIDNYSREFFNYSTAAWSYMSKNYAGAYGNANFEALMLGNIGAIINMHYREKYSWAIPKNIMDDLLPYYGLTCERDDYDEGIVKQSLEENMPVVVSASDRLIPVDGDIHCFVIDGYRKTHEEYTTYHYWVPDDGEPDFDPDHQSYYTTSRSDTEITSIKINWGWYSQWTSGINDGWYTLTDDWLTTLNNETQTWNHHRIIYHSFSLSTD